MLPHGKNGGKGKFFYGWLTFKGDYSKIPVHFKDADSFRIFEDDRAGFLKMTGKRRMRFKLFDP